VGFGKVEKMAVVKVVKVGVKAGGKVVRILVKVLLALLAGWLRSRDKDGK